jgi:phosphoribosylaminoimidazole-succinocarboxamide synthase
MTATTTAAIAQTNIPGLPCRRGKVRDIYDLGSEILLVATDRISAYDVVLPTPIPGKGAMLTALSKFWFGLLDGVMPHHFIEVVQDKAPPAAMDLKPYLDQLRGRATRCRKTQVVPIECVVRGYLAGSGWKEYRGNGMVCGVKLPAGLRQCDRLPEPIFTPATKAETGHDENISFDQACEIAGRDVMTLLRDRSLEIYRRAADHARARGIIIADTKFEFGRLGDELLLIDEVLTPDSSRFWPADKYEPGRDQDSFDKQFVRNYLTTLVEAGRWDKTPPGPDLPAEIVSGTAAKYREAVERLSA